MRKVKLALIAAAVVISIGGAFASRPSCQACTFSQQYHRVGSGYVATGAFGYDYACWQVAGTCTYYQPDPVNQPNLYVPCRSGSYFE